MREKCQAISVHVIYPFSRWIGTYPRERLGVESARACTVPVRIYPPVRSLSRVYPVTPMGADLARTRR